MREKRWEKKLMTENRRGRKWMREIERESWVRENEEMESKMREWNREKMGWERMKGRDCVRENEWKSKCDEKESVREVKLIEEKVEWEIIKIENVDGKMKKKKCDKRESGMRVKVNERESDREISKKE